MGALRQGRVLLVEDDEELRDALLEALELHGHQVVAVADGRAGLAQMRTQPPDVVLLDLMMPGMSGWQFRLEQRRDPALAATPVVAISGSQSPAAAAVDADVYLAKPFTIETVLRAIDDLIAAQRHRQALETSAHAERMAALGTLAAGVAHEINNPLTYVLLQLTALARQLPTLAETSGAPVVAPLETLVAGALEGVQRIRAITTGIRKFSRMDDDSRWHLDVRSPLEAALAIVGSSLDQRARLVACHEPAPYVLANEARLAQVFLALLTNAVQAIPEGAADRHVIRVGTAEDADGNAVIEIADTGIGIPEHLLTRIFEPFFTTRGVGEGTGLGLSISYGIVQSLGGELLVSSAPGRGTVVRVILPRAQARFASRS